MKRSSTFIPAAIAVVFVVVYYKTFLSEYAYLDEAHQLWNNRDGSNLLMFMVQGRWLTGLMIDQLFASVGDIAGLRQVRLISLAGWIITTAVWAGVARKWISDSGFTREVYLLSILFIIVSPSVAIAIGWASCVEIFLASVFGLMSGSMIATALKRSADAGIPGRSSSAIRTNLQPAVILTSIVFGVCSLFLYQNAFGLFVVPFLIDLFSSASEDQEKAAGIRRRLIIGVAIYLSIYVLYFLVFLYQVQLGGFSRSERAGISTDPAGKLLFFFSDALPKAFSLNFLNSRGSALPQVTAVTLFTGLVVSIILRWKKQGARFILIMLAATVSLLALVYLPSLVVAENFSSHRTLLPLSVAGFVVVMIQLFHFLHGKKARILTASLIALLLLVTGIVNYHWQFIRPVEREYAALKHVVETEYRSSIKSIYFIRPATNFFRSVYDIRPAKDEFGSPSTSREWVPEPLLRQMIFEINHNRRRTESLSILQFADKKAFIKSALPTDSTTLLIDMDPLIRLQAFDRIR